MGIFNNIQDNTGVKKKSWLRIFLGWIFKKPKRMICALIIVIIFIFCLLCLSSNNAKRERIETKSTLERVLKISELSTYRTSYDAVVSDLDENGKANYHVSYKGEIKAGIDMSQIRVEIEDKTVKIILPEVKVLDTIVQGTPKIMFVKDKYDKLGIAAEVYQICDEDIQVAAEENDVKKPALENAKRVVRALAENIVKEYDKEYVLEVFGEGEI